MFSFQFMGCYSAMWPRQAQGSCIICRRNQLVPLLKTTHSAVTKGPDCSVDMDHDSCSATNHLAIGMLLNDQINNCSFWCFRLRKPISTLVGFGKLPDIIISIDAAYKY